EIVTLDEACFGESLAHPIDQESDLCRRGVPEKPYHRHRRLLRPRRERPSRRRATEQRDELAPSDHSITSSARASSMGGRCRPSALAVCELSTSSTRVGCSTGKSVGFSPLRIRPT